MKKIDKRDKSLGKRIDDWLVSVFAKLIGYKRWRVNVDGEAQGRWKDFYDKEEALQYANQYKGSNYWVSLQDRDKDQRSSGGGTTIESVEINDPENPVKMGPTLEEMETSKERKQE